jgi:hypothetical protein
MELEVHLNNDQRELLKGLDTPVKIQSFLDTTLYRPEYSNLCPLQVMQTGQAHCLDGAIFAAAALKRLGFPPLLVDLFPDPGMDDDHVLAIFWRDGRLGAVAKSNFVGLRYREPVYRSLRELIMSYFEQFYNVNGVKTLRSFTTPLNLRRFDALNWEWTEEGVNAIEKALLSRHRFPLLTEEIIAGLAPVDEITFKAGLSAANFEGLYRPKG